MFESSESSLIEPSSKSSYYNESIFDDLNHAHNKKIGNNIFLDEEQFEEMTRNTCDDNLGEIRNQIKFGSKKFRKRKKKKFDVRMVSRIMDYIEQNLDNRIAGISKLIHKNVRDLKMAKKGFGRVKKKYIEWDREVNGSTNGDDDQRLLSDDIKFFFNMVKQKSGRATESCYNVLLPKPSPRFGGTDRFTGVEKSTGRMGDKQKTHKKKKKKKGKGTRPGKSMRHHQQEYKDLRNHGNYTDEEDDHSNLDFGGYKENIDPNNSKSSLLYQQQQQHHLNGSKDIVFNNNKIKKSHRDISSKSRRSQHRRGKSSRTVKSSNSRRPRYQEKEILTKKKKKKIVQNSRREKSNIRKSGQRKTNKTQNVKRQKQGHHNGRQPKRWERLYNMAIKKDEERKRRQAELEERGESETSREYEDLKQKIGKLNFNNISEVESDEEIIMQSKRKYLKAKDRKLSIDKHKRSKTPKSQKSGRSQRRPNKSMTPSRRDKSRGSSNNATRRLKSTVTKKSVTTSVVVSIEEDISSICTDKKRSTVSVNKTNRNLQQEQHLQDLRQRSYVVTSPRLQQNLPEYKEEENHSQRSRKSRSRSHENDRNETKSRARKISGKKNRRYDPHCENAAGNQPQQYKQGYQLRGGRYDDDKKLVRSRERYQNLEERQNIAELISRTQKRLNPSSSSKELCQQNSQYSTPQIVYTATQQQQQHQKQQRREQQRSKEKKQKETELTEFDECFEDPISSSTRLRKTLLTKRGFLKMLLPDSSTLKDELDENLPLSTARKNRLPLQETSLQNNNSNNIIKENRQQHQQNVYSQQSSLYNSKINKDRHEYTMASFGAEKSSMFAQQQNQSCSRVKNGDGSSAPQNSENDENFRHQEGSTQNIYSDKENNNSNNLNKINQCILQSQEEEQEQSLWKDLEIERRKVVELLESDILEETEKKGEFRRKNCRRNEIDSYSDCNTDMVLLQDISHHLQTDKNNSNMEQSQNSFIDKMSNIFKEDQSNEQNISSLCRYGGQRENEVEHKNGIEFTLSNNDDTSARITSVNNIQNEASNDNHRILRRGYSSDFSKRRYEDSNGTSLPVDEMDTLTIKEKLCMVTSNSSNSKGRHEQQFFSNFMSFKGNHSNRFLVDQSLHGESSHEIDLQKLGEKMRQEHWKLQASSNGNFNGIPKNSGGHFHPKMGHHSRSSNGNFGGVMSGSKNLRQDYHQRKSVQSGGCGGNLGSVKNLSQNKKGSSLGLYLSNSEIHQVISRTDYSETSQQEIIAAINLIKQVQSKTGIKLLDLCINEQKILQTLTTTSKTDLATPSITQPIKELELQLTNQHQKNQNQANLGQKKIQNSAKLLTTKKSEINTGSEHNLTQDSEGNLYRRIQRAKMFAKSAKALISTPLPKNQNSEYHHRQRQRRSQELYSQSTSAYIPHKSTMNLESKFDKFNSGGLPRSISRSRSRTECRLREENQENIRSNDGNSRKFYEHDSLSEKGLMLQFDAPQQ